jgi:hypothetical protein
MQTIDFDFETKRARRMTVEALRYSIQDAREALAAAEELDRAGYRANPGKYMDQIHVYISELHKREKKNAKN